MEFMIDYQEAPGILVATLLGELEPEGMLAYQTELNEQLSATQALLLVDMRQCQVGSVQIDALQQQATRQNAFGQAIRTALLVEGDHMYGLSRLYVANREVGEERIQVFRDYDEALGWLVGGEGNG
ncbi:MAG: hypothetical protein KDI36_17125 [Pseudomonadales bacterium]|nr:hypothetical protein [Pseudomonadales bacterium]